MKTVKVFISSTFKDMNAERDVLIKNVFPRLRARAEAELGVRIQEIDLRWGVTDEQAARGQVLELCLGGIDECRPYFLCMIGQRYGWVPAPMHINREKFGKILSGLSEEDKALLNKAYNGSVNDRVRSLDIKAPDELKEAAKAILLSGGIEEAGLSITEQEIKHALDEDNIPHMIVDLDKEIKKHRGGLSESEIELVEQNYKKRSQAEWMLEPGVTDGDRAALSLLFERIGLRKGFYTFFFLREPCGEDHKDFIETGKEQKDRLERLRGRLGDEEYAREKKIESVCWYGCKWDGNPFEGRHHIQDLDAFENLVLDSLWAHILQNPELKIPDGKLEGLDLEEELHRRFAENRIWNFCGRGDLLRELREKVQAALRGELANDRGAATQYVLLAGEPGSGKSAVMAKLKDDLLNSNSYKGAVLISRFVGATGNSTIPANLLADFIRILESECGFTDEVPFELNDLKTLFVDLLARSGRKVVILIDAVNQLRKENNRPAAWLPRQLPRNAAVVISLASGQPGASSEDGRFLEDIRSWHERPCEIEVKALEDHERREIVKTYLKQINKNLSDDQMNSIIEKREARIPLYVQVALEELRMVSRHEELPVFFHETLQETVEGMFGKVLERVEGEMEYVFSGEGRDLFISFAKYIAAGRNGMTEEDLRLLLGDWQAVDRKAGWKEKKSRIKDAGIDDFHWAELKRSLRAYLFQSGEEWNYFHLQLKQAVESRYMSGDGTCKAVHGEIAECLGMLGYGHLTTVKELPHHLIKAEKYEETGNVLCDILYIEARAKGKLLASLHQDYEEALDALPPGEPREDVAYFRALFMRQRHDLIKYPQLAFQQLYNDVKWKQGKLGEMAENARERYLERGDGFLNQRRVPDREASHLTATIHGQSGVNSCAYSPDGLRIVSGYFDGALKILDTETGSEIAAMTGHGDCVNCCAYSPQGDRVVSGSNDNTLKIWDSETGKEIMTLSGHNQWVTSCAFSPNGRRIVSGSRDNTLKIWDADTGTEIMTLKGHRGFITCCSYSPDGTEIVSGSGDKTLRLWDAETGKGKTKLAGHRGLVHACAYSPDGSRIAASSGYESIIVWDVKKHRKITTLLRKKSDVLACEYSPDGMMILAGGMDCAYVGQPDIYFRELDSTAFLLLYDLRSKEEIKLNGHGGPINSCHFSPDGRSVLSASLDRSIKIWDINIKNDVLTYTGHGMGLYLCVYSPTGNKTASVSWDNTVRIWDAETGKAVSALAGHKDRITSLAFSTDGRTLVTGSLDKTLMIWDTESGERNFTLAGHEEGVILCGYLEDNRSVFSSSTDRTLKVWDTRTGTEVSSVEGYIDFGGFVEYSPTRMYSPDGRRIATINSEIVSVWDTSTGSRVAKLDGNGGYVYGCDYSPDGRRIVSGYENCLLKIWDAETCKEIAALEGHEKSVEYCIYSPDGSKILSISDEEPPKVWDVRTRRELTTLSGHNRGVSVYSFSPDGRRIVTGSRDNTLRVWDAETGREIARFLLDCPAGAMTISPDGRNIACGDRKGNFYLLAPAGFDIGLPIVTGTRRWISGLNGIDPAQSPLPGIPMGHYSEEITVKCPACSSVVSTPRAVLDAIAGIYRKHHVSSDDSPCEKLPEEAWNDPRLVGECPLCSARLKFNPFIVEYSQKNVPMW